MIAGNDRHAFRRTDTLEPGRGRSKLGLQCQVDEITGDRDVIRHLRLQIGHQNIEHVAPVISVAVARPVQIAERALAHEFGKPWAWQRRQMRIG